MEKNSILCPNLSPEYELLDSGDNQKLEKFGHNVIMRPDSNCVWQKNESERNWNKANAKCIKQDGKMIWKFEKTFKKPWVFKYNMYQEKGSCSNELKFILRSSISKNIGIFPEQASNWSWIIEIIKKSNRVPKVLNLFGYTGAATICASAVGAEVCHVDASKSAVSWAQENQKLNCMEKNPIRWIVDDCKKFVTREIKRKQTYDAIIMDPPAFGRTSKGNIFEFEKNIVELLGLCKQVLVSKPLFFIFNGYAMGYSAIVLRNLLIDLFPGENIEFGELTLQQKSSKKILPCSLFARFKRKD